MAVVPLRQWIEPRELFGEWAAKPHCAWLDTATPPDSANRYSILAAEPFQVLRSKGREIEILSPAGATRREGDPFAFLGNQLASLAQIDQGQHPFPLGAAIGYFGYDLKNLIERLPATAADDMGLPDCWFGFYDHLLVFDHLNRQAWEIRSAAPRPSLAVVKSSCQSSQSGSRSGGLTSNFTRDQYVRAVLRAKEYIAAGDIYQVNLSQRFRANPGVPATEVYRALRQCNPAPYGAYLDLGDAQVLSSSPECFLHISGDRVVTRPIKGTRPRGANPEDDRRFVAELLASSKDNAELVMITDLERNDLGRVCRFGSVRVPELVRVEQYATVFHLVSTVEGRLRPEVSPVDCVRACLPGGSITGAPKIRAMEIIDELEPHARGVYTGAIGFLGFNGLTHLNIAIRTLVCQDGQLTFQAGGGIVADSDPDAEYEETIAKAKGILNAIDQLRVR